MNRVNRVNRVLESVTKSSPPDHAGVIAYPPFILTSFLVAGLVVQLVVHGLHGAWLTVTTWPVSVGLGLVSGLISARIALRGARQLRVAGTTILPSGSTTQIVSSGPYAFTRNPLYLAQGLLFLMIALGLNSLCMLLCLLPWWLVTHFGVVLREERYLTRKFGDAYLEYQRRVRRWI